MKPAVFMAADSARRRNRTRRVLLVGLALGLAGPLAAVGQESGRVAGVVRAADTGVPVEGAAVRLAELDVVATETVTDASGAFAFEGIAPGEYVLGVRRIGFAAYSVPLEVGPDVTAPLDVRLALDPVQVAPLEVDVEGRPLRLVETGLLRPAGGGLGHVLRAGVDPNPKRRLHAVVAFPVKPSAARAPIPLSSGAGLVRPEAHW